MCQRGDMPAVASKPTRSLGIHIRFEGVEHLDNARGRLANE